MARFSGKQHKGAKKEAKIARKSRAIERASVPIGGKLLSGKIRQAKGIREGAWKGEL